MRQRLWAIWEVVSALGVSHATHPSQVRPIRLSNQISVVFGLSALLWIPALWGLGDPYYWLMPIFSALYALTLWLKHQGHHQLGRAAFLLVYDALVTFYAARVAVEVDVYVLLMTNVVFSALFFSIEERRWLFSIAAAPVLYFFVLEEMQSRGTVVPLVLDPSVAHIGRLAVVALAFLMLAAAIVFLRWEQGRAEGQLRETIEDLKRQEAAALQAAAAKADFLATMSHEIRTPMNGVLGMVTLLKDSALGGPQQEMVETIQSSGEMLLAILNDVLDFSKIEAGALSLEAIPFSPATLVSQVLTLMRGRATAKGIELSGEGLSSLPPWLLGDPTRVQQVLYNLVGNAIKFTERGRVDVVARFTEGEGWVVEVIDTGVGIPADVLPRLFEAFSQADNSTSRRFGGTGLGLAISRRLVEAMGGEITVKSAVGVGSCFRVRLPLPVAEAPHAPQRDARRRARFEGARVLVAEDNAVNVRVLSMMLKKLGVVPVVVGDGRAALEKMTQEAWDVVLMDGQMPEMDGYAATAAYRAQEQGGRLPIVALTANVMAEDRQRAAEAGMDEVLEKPLQQERLQAVLSRYAPGSPAA